MRIIQINDLKFVFKPVRDDATANEVVLAQTIGKILNVVLPNVKKLTDEEMQTIIREDTRLNKDVSEPLATAAAGHVGLMFSFLNGVSFKDTIAADPKFKFNKQQLKDLALIFLYDLLIDNADRFAWDSKVGNHDNFFIADGRVGAIDNEFPTAPLDLIAKFATMEQLQTQFKKELTKLLGEEKAKTFVETVKDKINFGPLGALRSAFKKLKAIDWKDFEGNYPKNADAHITEVIGQVVRRSKTLIELK